MSVTKTEIFIASRFDEFADLRESLKLRINLFPVFPLEAVDLNDNVSGNAPPIGKCLAAVKRAEIMILLVGDTYGGSPIGTELSYTHLEYRAALDDNSNTVVLPFFISNLCSGNRFREYSRDKKLADWQKEIIDSHTPAFLDSVLDTRELCTVIFDAAYKAIYDARSTSIQEQMDRQAASEDLDPEDAELINSIDDSVGLSHDEMERLDSLFQADNNLVFESAESSFQNINDILLRPAEAASLEQKKEAFKAIELGDRFIAIRHLRKALEFRPLDFSATYWLARLLVSSGKNSNCRDAIRYGLIAAKMASYDKRPVKATASLMIASKAASVLQEYDEALEYAQRAVQESPWLASARIEVASQLAGAGRVEDALKEVRNAFFRMPKSILMANREPTLVKLGKRYQDFKKSLHDAVLKDATIILSDEIKAQQQLNASDNYPQEHLKTQLINMKSKPLLNLVCEGREASKRQLSFLQQQASSLLRIDDRAVDSFHSSKIDEHERNQRKNDVAINATLTDRNNSLTHILLDGGLALLLLVICVLIKQNHILAIVLLIAGLVSAFYCFKAWRRYQRHSEQLGDLQKQADQSDSIKISISNEADQIRQKASIKVKELCLAIVAFEKHVMQSQIFNVGKSIKKARLGDIVAIDTTLQTDLINTSLIDDTIVPASLASHCSDQDYSNFGRIKLYFIVNYIDGRPILSRKAVYFGI